MNGTSNYDKNEMLPNPEPLNENSVQKNGNYSQSKESAPNDEVKKELGLLYSLHDAPIWYTSLLLGIQHCFLALGGLVGIPFILGNALCLEENDVGYLARAMILNSMFFISGIATLLQVTFGTRLPILQAGCYSYLPPALAILALPHNRCPTIAVENESNTTNGTGLYNDSGSGLVDDNEFWMRRMREIQGSMAIAALVEFLLGLTGAVGVLTRFIGPLTVTASISLLGLSLFEVAANNASPHWGVAFFTVSSLIIFSQYLQNVTVPLPFYSKRKGWHTVQSNFVKLYPVLMTIAIAWLLCWILTSAEVLPDDPNEPGYRARTDIRVNVVYSSPWFRLPYPGQWGMPVISVAGVVGMIAGVLSSIVESIGDYYACARISGAPPVPKHAINRGIAIEGFGSVLAGLIGSGAGVTSYSENIGAIAITRVASRRVLQMAGAFLIVAGMLSKFGAILVLIPDPVIGGMFCVLFGMVASVGFSNLQHVDLNSPRNLFVVGFSVFMGLMVPVWVSDNENLIDTGVTELNQIVIVLLETSIFVGGVCAAFFDNTLPGTLEERGMNKWQKKTTDKLGSESSFERKSQSADVYELPFSTNWRFSKYIPILPECDKNQSECC